MKTTQLSDSCNSCSSGGGNGSHNVPCPNHGRQSPLHRILCYILAAIWWILCSFMVSKHAQLWAVFWSFCACWTSAASLWTILWVGRVYWKSVTAVVQMDPSPRSSVHNAEVDAVEVVATAALIRCLVGLVVYSALLLCHVCEYHRSSRSSKGWWWPVWGPISIATGYLAFDHWFASVWVVQGRWKKSLRAVVEDAVTLSLFLIALVHHWDSQVRHDARGSVSTRHSSANDQTNSTAATMPLLWTVYKFSQGLTTLKRWIYYYYHNQHVPRKCAPTATIAKTVVPFSASSPPPSPPPPPSLVWRIHGQVYDLRDYVSSHPGGAEAILLGQGRDDCTALFQSYHPFTIAHASSVLRKYRLHDLPNVNSTVVPLSPPPPPTLSKMVRAHRSVRIPGRGLLELSHEDEFYNILCQRVALALEQNGFHPIEDRAADTWRWLYYSIVLVLVIMCSVAHATGHVWGSFALAVTGWWLGALGHDAGHFTASRKWPILNDVAVWAMSLLCNPILWQHQHTFAHHSHTNELDKDPDLYHFGTLLRVHRRFRQERIYRNQASPLFVFLAYTFVVFGTCFWIPWGMIQNGSLYGIVTWTDRQRPMRTAGLYLHLLMYTGFIFVLPFWVHARWWTALAAMTIHVATSGLIFAIFSQVNHLNEPSLDPDAFARRRTRRSQSKVDHALGLNESWTVQQVETSNNFCPRSKVWHVLSNGLNLQIEHHLFPGLNHCHLHRIQPTVQAVCQEFGVCYKSYDSWSDLMQATLDWLDRLSMEPELKSD
jgi:fatty acid desaturase